MSDKDLDVLLRAVQNELALVLNRRPWQLKDSSRDLNSSDTRAGSAALPPDIGYTEHAKTWVAKVQARPETTPLPTLSGSN
jgi:hypothetical protein